MRNLIMMCLAGLLPAVGLSGCVTASDAMEGARPVITLSAPVEATGPIVVGTLATPGTYEMVVAPAMTRAKVLAERLNRRLKGGTIGLDQARDVRDALYMAVHHLEAAWEIKQPTADASTHMSIARAAMDLADKRLESDK